MPLLDYIFPKHCLNCNSLGSYICSNCLPTLQRHNQVCISCRKPSPWGATHSYCQPYSAINNLIIACVYKDTIREAIHKIKYKFAYDIITELCEKTLNSQKIQQRIREKQIEYVTNIPSHTIKYNKRGFNLPSYIAHWVAQKYNIPYHQLLEKHTPTIAQVSLHRQDRLFNMQNTLRVINTTLVQNKKILIVDDILTTGSTLEEAAKILNQQHAEYVVALALASSK